MKNQVLKPLLCLAILALMLNFASAQEKSSEVDLKITEVSLFKNGLGFFHSEAELVEDATTIHFGQMPVPAYGTFFVAWPEDMNVKSLVTSLEEVETMIPANTLVDLVFENPGRKVRVRLKTEKPELIEGVILDTSPEKDEVGEANPYYMDAVNTGNRYRPSSAGYGPSQIISLKTDEGKIMSVNVGDIMFIEFEDDDIVKYRKQAKNVPGIRMELGSPSDGETINTSYLARGITWTPGYQIDISDPETAGFSARALIINEVADLENVKVNLITGFPHIKFSDIVSPVSMKENLEDFLNSLSGGRSESRGRQSHVMTQRAVTYNYASYEAPAVPGYSTASEGAVAEDLFLYPIENVTLKKKETAWIPLFTEKMPYEHIYTWKIGDYMDQNENYQHSRNRNQEEEGEEEEVWHCCRITNTLEMPLTTSAAEFIKDGQFVGQDICYYTAPGADTTIKINRAMNVLAKEAEVEVERTRNAEKFHGYSYDLVNVRGELKIKNRLDKTIKLEAEKNLSGEVLETSPEAKDVKTAKGLKQINPKHVLTWDLELEPGEEKTVNYTYQVYIRS